MQKGGVGAAVAVHGRRMRWQCSPTCLLFYSFFRSLLGHAGRVHTAKVPRLAERLPPGGGDHLPLGARGIAAVEFPALLDRGGGLCYLFPVAGDVAQMGERSVRNAEVGSSILLVSTQAFNFSRLDLLFDICA